MTSEARRLSSQELEKFKADYDWQAAFQEACNGGYASYYSEEEMASHPSSFDTTAGKTAWIASRCTLDTCESLRCPP